MLVIVESTAPSGALSLFSSSIELDFSSLGSEHVTLFLLSEMYGCLYPWLFGRRQSSDPGSIQREGLLLFGEVIRYSDAEKSSTSHSPLEGQIAGVCDSWIQNLRGFNFSCCIDRIGDMIGSGCSLKYFTVTFIMPGRNAKALITQLQRVWFDVMRWKWDVCSPLP